MTQTTMIVTLASSEPVAWLSLDEGDNDLTRFLTYLIAALQTLPPKTGGANIGAGVLGALQSPQPPPTESILTALLNEITTIADDFVLVLDDYHLVESPRNHAAVAFLLEHLPANMHLVIGARRDPPLPLARLRSPAGLDLGPVEHDEIAVAILAQMTAIKNGVELSGMVERPKQTTAGCAAPAAVGGKA